MFEMFSMWTEMQREAIAVQKKQMDAWSAMLGGGQAMLGGADQFRRAQEAQADAMKGWMKMWGWRG